MGPASDTTQASKLHGAYDEQYLLRLVSQEGRPGIFAFETCLHDQGVARQGTCVSALQNLKGEPVPISVEVIASEQLNSEEAQILAAVKREHRQYTSALAARAEQGYGPKILAFSVGGPSLMAGGVASAQLFQHAISGLKKPDDFDELAFKRARWALKDTSDELVKTSRAFDRFLATSAETLKREGARQAKFLGVYAEVPRNELYEKILPLVKDNAQVDLAKELENFNAHSTRSIFNQDLVKWLDETGLPEPLRKTLQAKGLSIDEYLRKPSTFDVLIFDKYGNNKQAFDEIVRTAMGSWPEISNPHYFGYRNLLNPRLESSLAGLDEVVSSVNTGAYTVDKLLETDLRGYIARFDEFRVEFPTRFKTQDVYRAMLRNYELNAVKIHSYHRWRSIKELLDEVAKGRFTKQKRDIARDIVQRMAATVSGIQVAEGEALLTKIKDLRINKLPRLRYEVTKLAPHQPKAQQGQIAFFKKMGLLKGGKLAAMVTAVIGFGASIYAGALHSAKAASSGDDHHEEEWLALLESGQVDLITDFSSSLWMPDATEHAAAPSVKELMIHLTLFQRHLWFGETSDAPDVVQIVRHCLPQKTIDGGVRAQCESVGT